MNSKPDWWKSEGGFFGKNYLEADDSYEGFLNSPKDMTGRITEEVKGVIRLCNLKNNKVSVLDAPCGYGRHSIGLAQQNCQVDGVDINDYFLDTARKKVKDLKLDNVKFHKKDLRKLRFKNRFNAVINMFYSFGFFEEEKDDLLVVSNFYNALKKDGKFLMHTFITVPKIKSGDYKKHEIRNLVSGHELELVRDFDYKTRRENGEWNIVKGNKKISSLAPYSMRIYTDLEFIGLCIKAGFRKVDVYGDWKGSKYRDDSELMIVVATK